jgi:hypothetical protein
MTCLGPRGPARRIRLPGLTFVPDKSVAGCTVIDKPVQEARRRRERPSLTGCGLTSGRPPGQAGPPPSTGGTHIPRARRQRLGRWKARARRAASSVIMRSAIPAFPGIPCERDARCGRDRGVTFVTPVSRRRAVLPREFLFAKIRPSPLRRPGHQFAEFPGIFRWKK